MIKSIKNIFILKKENKEIKDRIIRDNRTLFEQEDDYYKPKRVSNFWNNNYIEYENNGDRNKNVSLKEYLDKIKPYLKDIIIGLQESDTWKILLTIVINFISSKDDEEDHVMHLKSDNEEFLIYDHANQLLIQFNFCIRNVAE